MLGRSKPVVFDPYGRRKRRRVPRWLVLLLMGGALGASGVLLVQQRVLPPRLSAQASVELRQSFERADSERKTLATQLADTRARLDAALAEGKRAQSEMAVSREAAERLRQDVSSLVASLPPDPRGGAVEVRAARFTVEGSALAYDVVLSRDKGGTKPLAGVMKLVLAGEGSRGTDDTVASEPIAISLGRYENLRGSLPMPQGFKPRQTTIHVLDKADGKRLGMRVINVK